MAVRIARSVPLPRITDRPGRSAGRHPAGGHVHAPIGKRFEHEPAEPVVADDPDEAHRQPEPSRSARGDRARAADRQPDVLHEPLRLAERGPRVGVRDDDVGVDLADDEQVDVAASPPQYRSYQPGAGGSGRRAAAHRGRHGARDAVHELDQPGRGARARSWRGRRRAPRHRASLPRPTPTARPARRSRPPGTRPGPGARTSRRRRRPTAAPTAAASPRRARRRPRASGPRR